MTKNKKPKFYFFKTPEYKDFQLDAGSVSRNDIKSVWFGIKGFMESNENDHRVDLRHFLQRLRFSIEKALKREGMNSKYIMDTQIKESYYRNYYCFYGIEFNFFVVGETNYRIMQNKIIEISKYVNNVFETEKKLKMSKYVRKTLTPCQNQENETEKKPITAE